MKKLLATVVLTNTVMDFIVWFLNHQADKTAQVQTLGLVWNMGVLNSAFTALFVVFVGLGVFGDGAKDKLTRFLCRYPKDLDN